VVVKNGEIIGKGMNSTITLSDPTAHAEILAIKEAARSIGNYRLLDSTIYVTVEPCSMCAGAIVLARIKRVVIGVADLKAGACGSVLKVIPNEELNHRPEVSFGVCKESSYELIKRFFADKRKKTR